jgi:phosphotransferase system, enzyme I, PtsP
MLPEQKKWPDIRSSNAEDRDKKASEFLDAQITLAAPKRLMASLRDIMRGTGQPEEKLDAIVKLIGGELRADDCSCYVLRAGEVLELYSAFGISPEGQRKENYSVGEGIVGEVAATAAPIVAASLEPISSDPDGAIYKSFCGVPILRGGRVRGALVIRNRLQRAYGEEAVDILQTTALLLAELIVAGGLMTRLEINSSFSLGGMPMHVEGVSLGRGLAIGTAVLYEPAISMQDNVADDTTAEKQRLAKALSSMHNAIDRMLNRNTGLHGTESRDILEAYQMFAKDRGWLARIEQTIEKGLSAEAAVQRVQNETRARMMRMNDAYIRERLQDLEDLSNRLLSHLLKQKKAKAPAELPDSIVLVARSRI